MQTTSAPSLRMKGMWCRSRYCLWRELKSLVRLAGIAGLTGEASGVKGVREGLSEQEHPWDVLGGVDGSVHVGKQTNKHRRNPPGAGSHCCARREIQGQGDGRDVILEGMVWGLLLYPIWSCISLSGCT